MIQVVGIRFRRTGKIYYFDPGDLPLQIGQHVVVETVRGVELGEVAVAPHLVAEEEVVQPLKKVMRMATEADIAQVQVNKEKEGEAYQFAQAKVHELGLEMKLVDVEYTFDQNKLVFYFTADKRIDFRELVKELACRFRTRIELRQIGVRDEAKMLGGLGVCGQGLCCSTWIGDFAPVSIRHAKDQELSMNPNKISGVCGRLKCCLRYEAQAYEDARARQPHMGETIMLPTGEARVVAVNLLRERVTVQVAEGTRTAMTWEEFRAAEPVTAPDSPPAPPASTVSALEEVVTAISPAPVPVPAPEPEPAAKAGTAKRAKHGHNKGKQRKGDAAGAPARGEQGTGSSENGKPARRPKPKRVPPAEAVLQNSAQASQEIAAGSDDENHVQHKRRRWRRRKPKNSAGGNKGEAHDAPAGQ